MVSFASRATQAAAAAGDFEVFRSALRAGLDVEHCAAVTAANAAASHSEAWMLFANRLERGTDLYTSVFDLRRVANSFIFDDLAELLLLARSHNWPGLESLLSVRSRFLRAWARDQLQAASRIRAATSVGWLAAAAPWVLVLLLFARPENRSIFATVQGIALLLIGAVLTAASLVVSARITRPKVVSRVDATHPKDVTLHLAGRVEVLSFLLNAGVPLRLAVERALTEGEWAKSFQLERFGELVASGGSLQEAAWAVRADSKNDRLNELLTKLAISDQLGMVDSAEFYELGQALREQWLVQQSAAAASIETKLLLPQVILSLPLTVLLALYPSLSLLSSSLL
jgi:Flp pilus assembly protein TadB